MIKYDLHLHSSFSTDSTEKMNVIVDKAIELGLKGLCFTDHMDLYFPEKCSKKSGGDFTFDLNEYFDSLDFLRQRYKGRIEILFGVETGLRNEPGLKAKCFKGYRQMAAEYPFDFIIGSTHCLEDIDPYWEEYWNGRTAEEGLNRYFDAIAENCTYFDSFDSLGHLDYLVRYVSQEATVKSLEEKGLTGLLNRGVATISAKGIGDSQDYMKRLYGREVYDPADFTDHIETILRKVIDRGLSLEVNTAGLKYGLGFAHPRKEILKMYRSMGGELITIGSDAHAAVHLAYEFENVGELLKTLGFKYYFVYKDRKPIGLTL